MAIPGIILALLIAAFAYALVRHTQKRTRREERKKLEDQLREAQRLETLGQLTGGIAHDLNNIISIILGYSEMARDSTLEGSRTRYNLEEALKAGYRARDLLQQLLTISRGDAPEHERVDIVPLVSECLRLVRTSLPRTVKIERELAPDAGRVSVDPSQIYQVIVNLCLNAGYAMRDAGGTLTVAAGPFDVDEDFGRRHGLQTGPHVKLTIGDTGGGIPPDVQARIFEPFFTTKPPGEGTGLGLSLVHRIVADCGGAIVLESEPGSGATFHVYLPASKARPGAESLPGPALDTRERACVLFVDDEAELTRMAQQILERMGYDVVTKTDSMDAVQAFQDEPDRYQVIVTDYFMPNLTGTDLARRVQDVRPDIPLILITGFSSAITPERASEVGFKEYLLKPMAAQDLGRAIERALSAQS